MRRAAAWICSLAWLPLAHAELKAATDFESDSARVLALDPSAQTVRIAPAGDPACGMPNW